MVGYERLFAAMSADNGADGIDLSAMDTAVKPWDDFFQYANGGWLAHAVIPAEEGSEGVGHEVETRGQVILRTIAEKAAADKSTDPSSPEGKVGAFYRSGMDEARIEADGITPLAGELNAIDSVRDTSGLMSEIAHLHRVGVGAAFNFGVEQDPGASSQQIASVSQGGFSLPERGYYIRADKETQATRDAFLAHIVGTFGLMGETPDLAAKDAQIVLALETKLALASSDPVDLRDPQANYHKMRLRDFASSTPGIDWKAYFSALKTKEPKSIDVGQPHFFVALASTITQTPLADWKTYLRWVLIDTEEPRLNKALSAEHFHFYATVLDGTEEQRPRWKRILAAVDNALGDDLGRLYVAAAFSPEAKSGAYNMAVNLKAALREDLSTLPWMGESTRKAAIAKLDSMVIKVGYPDRWRDYSRLDVMNPSYVVNAMRAEEFEFQRNLDKIGKPVDLTEWGMTPPTVNAYYDDSRNDINFPAGILQPPFYDVRYDDAVNYGDTGATIGHEMTHGFDDGGRKFDAHGNLKDWWTAKDLTNFNLRAQGIIAQYSAFEPIPGLHINGELTQGENIADLGGLKIAYLAFEKAIQGKPRTLIDGFTPEQRFFIAYAQSYRNIERPEALKVRLLSDPHSPDKFRVLGPVADMPEFRQAFGAPPDTKPPMTTIW